MNSRETKISDNNRMTKKAVGLRSYLVGAKNDVAYTFGEKQMSLTQDQQTENGNRTFSSKQNFSSLETQKSTTAKSNHTKMPYGNEIMSSNNFSDTEIAHKPSKKEKNESYIDDLEENFNEVASAEDEAVMGEEDLADFTATLGSGINYANVLTEDKNMNTTKLFEQYDEAGFSGDDRESMEDLNQLNKSHQVQNSNIHKDTSKFGPWYPSPWPVSPINKPYNMQQYNPDVKYQFYYVEGAEQKGALCLDGSLPGFYFRKGFTHGVSKWIIYLQGGAWCSSEESCYRRSTTDLGSSEKFRPLYRTSGFLSHLPKENPDFYNWNVAYVKYCDGASFAGNRSNPIKFNGKLLYFRGKRILNALIDDLKTKGMNQAENIIFSGTSAGGLAAMLHADSFRAQIPGTIPVFVLSDAGYFVDAPSMKGPRYFRHQMQRVCRLHKCFGGVNKDCVSVMKKDDRWKCLFPQYFVPHIQTPLFIVNPLYDSWQLHNILKVRCVNHVERCSKEEKAAINRFKKLTLIALKPVHNTTNNSLFADSCILHGQVVFAPHWQNVKVKGKSIHSSFGSWVKSQHSKILIDSEEYPKLNPSC